MYRRPSGSESIGSGNSKKLGTLCFVNHIAVIYASLALNLVSLGGCFISSNVPSARVLHPSGSRTQRSGFGPEEGVPNFAVSTTAGLATEVLGRTGANLQSGQVVSLLANEPRYGSCHCDGKLTIQQTEQEGERRVDGT